VSCSLIISGVLVLPDGPTEPAGLAVQEAPEKRPQAATCQQSFVKLGLMACPSGRQTPQPIWRLAARSPKHGGVGGDRAAFYYDAVGKGSTHYGPVWP
jgi:hypothetical protein